MVPVLPFQTTPTATTPTAAAAAAGGCARVAPKVTSSATFPVWAVLHTIVISPGRSDLTAAKISTAPSVGIANRADQPGQRDEDDQHPEPGKIDASG